MSTPLAAPMTSTALMIDGRSSWIGTVIEALLPKIRLLPLPAVIELLPPWPTTTLSPFPTVMVSLPSGVSAINSALVSQAPVSFAMTLLPFAS